MSLNTDLLIMPLEAPREQKTITLSYSNYVLPITVWFEARNRLRITVFPEKTIMVKAPMGQTMENVLIKLEKRTPWIIRQLDYFDQYHPIFPNRRYVSGETHYYLGRQYRLKVMPGSKNDVKLIGRFFLLTTNETDNFELKRSLLQDWFSTHAKALILGRVQIYKDRVVELGAKKLSIKFRKMNKRWGSCTPSGLITFNTELIIAPLHCIDYVVLHELCHLVHERHNDKFYHLLDVFMPDWRKRKEQLEKVILLS